MLTHRREFPLLPWLKRKVKQQGAHTQPTPPSFVVRPPRKSQRDGSSVARSEPLNSKAIYMQKSARQIYTNCWLALPSLEAIGAHGVANIWYLVRNLGVKTMYGVVRKENVTCARKHQPRLCQMSSLSRYTWLPTAGFFKGNERSKNQLAKRGNWATLDLAHTSQCRFRLCDQNASNTQFKRCQLENVCF